MTDSEDTFTKRASSKQSHSESSLKSLFAKIVMVGNSGVGKSSLLHRFCKGSAWLDEGSIGSTIGVDMMSKEIVIDNYCVELQVWDTAGQERYHSLINSYFRNAVGVVAVYDVTSRYSFQNLETWLRMIKSVNTEPVIIIVGNKIDGERQVSRSEGLQFSKDRGSLFMETSVLIGHGITHIFEKLIRKVLQSETLFNQMQAAIVKREANGRGGLTSHAEFQGCQCN